MTQFRHLLFLSSLAIAIAAASGCTFNAGTGGQRHEGAGVTFVVPLQTSEVTNGPDGIDYRSANVKATTDGRTLTVNGKSHGSLKPGDVVEFQKSGAVLVNGIPRTADGT